MVKRTLLFVLVIELVAASAFAQLESPVAPQYSEEIEVRVIDVDVIVTDREGHPLTNLTRQDFELYEDGKRVDIAYFSRIVGRRVADMPPTAGENDTIQQQPRVPVTWVVFIDHSNLSPQARNIAMRHLQVFFERNLTDGDRGLIAINDGRSFRLRQGMTEDPHLLMEMLRKLEKERMSVNPIKNRANIILSQIRRSEQEMLVPVDRAGMVTSDESEFMAITSGGEISTLILEEAERTKAAIRALGSLLDALAMVEGRVALVYVGAGFNTIPAANLTATWRARFGYLGKVRFEPKPEEERQPIEREIESLYDNLSAMRVTVYTIHGGDDAGGPTSVEDRGQLNPYVASSIQLSELTEASHAREMAQRTGGLYFKVNPALATQLEAARSDLDNHYSLGFKPSGSPNDKRRIKVRVNVDGARVRHRGLVRERTRAEKAAASVAASMMEPQRQARGSTKVGKSAVLISPAVATAANPLRISIEADRPKRDGWGSDHLLPFNFSMPLESLTFVKRNQVHRAEFVMSFALVGNDGSVYQLESREQALTLPDSDTPATAEQATSHRWHVDLAPLRIPRNVPAEQKGLRLTVTVEDRFSGTRSVVTVPVGM